MADSLRDALEKLVAERDSVSGHTASDYMIRPYEIADLLRDHPAEPVGVSDEALSKLAELWHVDPTVLEASKEIARQIIGGQA